MSWIDRVPSASDSRRREQEHQDRRAAERAVADQAAAERLVEIMAMVDLLPEAIKKTGRPAQLLRNVWLGPKFTGWVVRKHHEPNIPMVFIDTAGRWWKVDRDWRNPHSLTLQAACQELFLAARYGRDPAGRLARRVLDAEGEGVFILLEEDLVRIAEGGVF